MVIFFIFLSILVFLIIASILSEETPNKVFYVTGALTLISSGMVLTPDSVCPKLLGWSILIPSGLVSLILFISHIIQISETRTPPVTSPSVKEKLEQAIKALELAIDMTNHLEEVIADEREVWLLVCQATGKNLNFTLLKKMNQIASIVKSHKSGYLELLEREKKEAEELLECL